VQAPQPPEFPAEVGAAAGAEPPVVEPEPATAEIPTSEQSKAEAVPAGEDTTRPEPAAALTPAEPVDEAIEVPDEQVQLPVEPEASLETEQAEATPEPPPPPLVEPPAEPVSGLQSETGVTVAAAEAAFERLAEEPRPAPPPEPPPADVAPGAMAADTTPADTSGEEVIEARSIQGSKLDRLLRRAAARGASAMYLVTGLAPVVRVDGAITPLEGTEVPSADDVSSMMLELAPDSQRGALESGEGAEWVSDVADIGRVRCLSFTDHRGPGGIFRMLTAQALTVEQLGLSPEVQALCAESEGLVLIAGPRLSGKSTLLTGLVELVNRSRADYVITIEGQIQFVHESRRAFVSQREVSGGAERQAAAVRAALREDPDVIAIDALNAPETLALALEAAQSGRLVFCSVPAPSATAAIEQLVSQFPNERRDRVYAALASTLRGVVAQVLLRRLGGGKVAARELLLNTRAIASVLLERQLVALAPALDQGRALGMAPLNDALVSLVRSGAVAPADAFRKSSDQDGFLAELRRQGIDTSFVERLT